MNSAINEKLEAMRLQLEGKKTLDEGEGMTRGASAAVMHAGDVIAALKDLAGLFDYRLFGDGSHGWGQEELLTPEQKQQAKDMLREVQKMTDEAKAFQTKLHAISKKMRHGKFDDFMHFS